MIETKQSRDIKEHLRKKFVFALKRWQNQTSPRRSRKEFARRIGCDPSLISYWANGTCFPGWEKLPKVSENLGVPLKWWLEDSMVLPEPEKNCVVFSEDQKSSVAGAILEAKGKLDLSWAELGDQVGYSVTALTAYANGRQRTDAVTEVLYRWLMNDVPRLLEESKFVDPNQGELF